jgi:hypothetical protein
MGLVQTGKRDPCKAQPLNKSMTRLQKGKKEEENLFTVNIYIMQLCSQAILPSIFTI